MCGGPACPASVPRSLCGCGGSGVTGSLAPHPHPQHQCDQCQCEQLLCPGPGGGWSPGGGPPPDHGATGGHAELHTTVGTQLGVQGVSSSAGTVQCMGDSAGCRSRVQANWVNVLEVRLQG